MSLFGRKTIHVDSDVLVIGGGMALAQMFRQK